MSDYQFDIEDVDSGDESIETGESGFDAGSVLNAFKFVNLALLPISIFTVYAFIEKATVVGALTSLFGGASGLALAVGTAAWLVGGIIVAGIGLVAIWSATAILVGLVTRNGAKLGIGLLGGAYLGICYAGSTYLLSGIPTLVGFFIISSALMWGGVLAIGGISVVAGIVIS